MSPTLHDPVTARKPNWALLSLMRFSLAMLVLASHVAIITVSPLEALRRFSPWAAVIAFFSISGFSIAHSIHRKPHGYLNRRFWRIYPTFFVAMILSSIPFAFQSGRIELPNLLVDAPTHLQIWLNYIPVQAVFVKPLGTNGPLWSLGIEEFFYLCAPLLLKLPRAVFWSFIIGSATLYCFKQRLGLADYATSASLLSPLALSWAWLLGWSLWIKRDEPLTQISAIVIPCACVALYNPFGGALASVTVAITALLIIHQNAFGSFSPRISQVASWLGDWSFPIYICHFPVFILAYRLGIRSWWALVLCALVIAVLVLHLVDHPLRKARASSR